jgi:hypothetical protein
MDRHVAAAHFRAACLMSTSQVLFVDETTGIAEVILLYKQSCEHCASLDPKAPHGTSTVFLQPDGDDDRAEWVLESTKNESGANLQLPSPKRALLRAAPPRAPVRLSFLS